MSIIEQVYKEDKYYLACRKIAGQDADDLYQHVNLKILERERKGKLSCNNFYQYYYMIARNEYISKAHSFQKIHKGRVQTTKLNGINPVDYSDNSNDFLTLVDAFARTPSKTKSEKFLKELYLECTSTGFKGVTDLSHRTGINKYTIYGALQRFKQLYNDYSDSL